MVKVTGDTATVTVLQEGLATPTSSKIQIQTL